MRCYISVSIGYLIAQNMMEALLRNVNDSSCHLFDTRLGVFKSPV